MPASCKGKHFSKESKEIRLDAGTVLFRLATTRRFGHYQSRCKDKAIVSGSVASRSQGVFFFDTLRPACTVGPPVTSSGNFFIMDHSLARTPPGAEFRTCGPGGYWPPLDPQSKCN